MTLKNSLHRFLTARKLGRNAEVENWFPENRRKRAAGATGSKARGGRRIAFIGPGLLPKDDGRRPPPRPAPLPLSQFSHGELTMGDIRPGHFSYGCSNLAKTSRGRNKTIRKTFAATYSYSFDYSAIKPTNHQASIIWSELERISYVAVSHRALRLMEVADNLRLNC